MNKYDKLTYVILNRILKNFGMRVANNDRIVFLYKVINYVDGESRSNTRVIHLSNDIEGMFNFLRMDYKDYKKKDFKHIFEYVSYMTDKCPFFTKTIVKYLRDELDKESFEIDEELKKQVLRFVRTIVLSHSVLREFDFTPLLMYKNLREAVVRRHFDSDKVTEQIVNAKLEFRDDKDLIGKFSGLNVTNWIHALRKDSKLTGIFIQSFVDHVTSSKPANFPRFLIDNEKTIIKQEVLSYYYHIFPQSEAYRTYMLECIDKDNGIVI